MKKLFKKVVALAAGASMVGATIMGAMAADLADYPAPFISDGTFSAIMVVGDTAAPADIIGVTDIAMSLQYASKTSTGTTSAVTVSASGEAYKIETSTNKLNLGNKLTDVQTTPINDEDLPTLLADGSYRNDESSDFEYEQEIELNDTATFSHFADSDYEDKEPTLGIKFVRAIPVLQYKLKFTKSAESDYTSTTLEDFEDTDITMLGKEYSIVTAKNESSKAYFELMGGAIKDTLEEGQIKTYTLDNKEFEVENVIVTDTGTLYTQFKVNGEATKKLAEGQTDKLSDGTQVGIRTILQNEAGDVTQDMVEFYLGAEKMKIEDDTECASASDFNDNVELNDEDVDDLYGDIYFDDCDTTPTLNKFVLTWKPDDDTFVTEESTATMPGLESIKLNFEGYTTEYEETVAIENDGKDKMTVKIPIKGQESGFEFDLLYAGNTTHFTHLGGDGTDENLLTLAVCTTTYLFNRTYDQYALASDSVAEETHFIEVTKVDDTDGVTFKDAATGTTYEDKKLGSFTIGDVTINVISFDETSSAVVFQVTGSGAVCNKIYTPQGLTMTLPATTTYTYVESATAKTSGITTGTETYVIDFAEEDKDEGTLGNGEHFNVTLTRATDAHVGAVGGDIAGTYEIGDTDVQVGYQRSDLGSKIEYDQSPDQDTATITYFGGQTYGNLYLSSTGTTFKKAGSSGTATEVVKIEVGAAKLASKIAGREKQENLIIVGGPCVNTAARVIMGTGADCTEGFTPGKAMIKLYENSGKVAVVVAGYAAEDTTAACQVVANFDDPAYTADFKGTELEVTETTSSQPKIGAPTVVEAAEAEAE